MKYFQSLKYSLVTSITFFPFFDRFWFSNVCCFWTSNFLQSPIRSLWTFWLRAKVSFEKSLVSLLTRDIVTTCRNRIILAVSVTFLCIFHYSLILSNSYNHNARRKSRYKLSKSIIDTLNEALFIFNRTFYFFTWNNLSFMYHNPAKLSHNIVDAILDSSITATLCLLMIRIRRVMALRALVNKGKQREDAENRI